jgi:hypothetical protein
VNASGFVHATPHAERFEIHDCPAGSATHLADLALLEQDHVSVPHHYRSGTRGARWCRIQRGEQLLSGFLMEVQASRTVPGSRLLRVERVGRILHEPVAGQFGLLVASYAQRTGRVLRLNVALFDEDHARRTLLAQSLRSAGFEPVAGRSYTTTLRVPLAGGVDAVRHTLSWSTRRNLRAAMKHGVYSAPLSNPEFAPRCQALYEAAFTRTGHRAPPVDFRQLFAMSNDRDATLIGVFAPGVAPSPETLVAFAWVRSHGDYATYDTAGSARLDQTKGVTAGDVLMMACIEWAQRTQHLWLDLGGVSISSDGAADPVAGISAFKRGFSKDVVTVGEEWVLHPNHLLAATERMVRRLRSILVR